MQVTVAASHSDSSTDAADCGPEIDHTLDAIEQRWLEMRIEMRQKIAKDLSEMGKKMRLDIAKEVSEMGKTMRQEIVDRFTAMLAKASNGNDDVTTSSRSQETWMSAPQRPKGESVPEITPDFADTGIIGIVVVLVSLKRCLPIGYSIAVKYNQD